MIEPDDIPDELVERWACEIATMEHFTVSPWLKQIIAEKLDMAIEAGVVSPPCHVIKCYGGYLSNNGHGKILVRAARERAGLSQLALAQAVNLRHQSTVSKYEMGRNFPHLPAVIRICKVLNVSMDEIFRD
jgi:DNA-binding XRE family transcriptional regulator